MDKKFISICIPSYNRPETLSRLLESVDSLNKESIEIVICEDNSPRRGDVRMLVEKYKKTTKYAVNYHENEKNLGFDKNLKQLINISTGEWIIFMGDDDAFVPRSLDKFFEFIKNHSDLGYVLRSYRLVSKNGKIENFKYYNENKFFPPGSDSYLSIFRKSVFVSGFSIRRDLILPFLIDDFDGTLLFQLYLASEVALHNSTAYFNEILTEQYERELQPFFGNSETEKSLYTPGTVTIRNSINFMKGFSQISLFIDKKYKLNLSPIIIRDISKYSYPVLSIQRNKGLKNFFSYIHELNNLGFNVTIYYYLYIVFLVLFGQKICDWGIRVLKKIFGKTPSL